MRSTLTHQWIAHPDQCLSDWRQPVRPAPLFRREIFLAAPPRLARLRICGLGFHELRINGEKVGDHVLDPIVTQYDRRVRYVVHDVTAHLREGINALGVMLGNGWYNCFTPDVWHFDKAAWRDYPKLWLELQVEDIHGECTTLCTDKHWRVGDGPVRVDGLRSGETYDAREERPGWDAPGFDDSRWLVARVVPAPGGVLEEQTSPPCKIVDTLVPISVREIRPGVAVYDMGVNIAGWARLHVAGEPGQEIVLRYGERLKDTGELDQGHIASFILGGECQTDRYICRGGESETWEPRFTYHGFQYVQVEGLKGAPSLETIRARVVHTAFESAGSFACSDETVNRLQICTRRAYLGNFVGIPTDCPHREKNGWTGDAHLAAETGLLNFTAASSYRQWLQTLADTQRPSGQLPGIAPSAGWGYNWGSGPAWDAALVLIPGYIHLYTGDDSVIREQYDNIRRYLDFCASMADGHILEFGLGDWCCARPDHMPTNALTSTAYYHVFARETARYARLLGHTADAVACDELAGQIRLAFHNRFHRGDGRYDNGSVTAQSCALYQGLVEEGLRASAARRLAEAVEASGVTADFGILGAKYTLRALAENGFEELAFRLITQPAYPGWACWLAQGATTLWENWNGADSRNHIMFGDISAWFIHYLGGIRPDPEQPGFKRVIFRPCFVGGLSSVEATHRSPHGLIRSGWKREGKTIRLDLELPVGVEAEWNDPPSGVASGMPSGQHVFTF
ncbi:MAG TPA: family 78 glycoside hydrolase catalytic domain [Kiritimatiellia bacterium]|nr:family 78 glycoside hydrolase catalytic domain [Kiritimatiellia bacterium]